MINVLSYESYKNTILTLEQLLKNNYVVYHLHDDTSNCNGYADSCTKYEEYIKLAKECGMKAIAFSNHGGAYDWVKKKLACDKAGIKYIHGTEFYITPRLEDNTRGYHIGLYSKNWDGVLELNELMSRSSLKGVEDDNSDRHMYYNYRISFEELFNTSDNIIVTTACLASALWKLSDKSVLQEHDGVEKYKNNLENRDRLLDWIGKNRHRCFFEIQYHNAEHQKEYNLMLKEWSEKYDVLLIAGTDTHSSTKYKAECRKILQISKDSFYGEEDEFDLTWKTCEELVECFRNQGIFDDETIFKAINNTNLLADMVEDFSLDRCFKYPTLYGEDASELWQKFISKKLQEKIDDGAIDVSRLDEYMSVIKEEYDAMSKQGMQSFMLFMGELLEWCYANDIYVSPCRGSVGGSLVAYVTGITDVDPLKWKTVFSRFCNADRISLADIDVDFSPRDRQRVYKYIIERFGSDKVSYILTMGTIKDRGSIDVLAKGLNYTNLKLVREIKDNFDGIFKEYSKIIMEEVNLEELEDAESKSPDFVDHELYVKTIRNAKAVKRIEQLKYQWDKMREDNKDLFYYFDGIKGTIISKGIHPAGMIGSPITIADNLGVYHRDGDINQPVSICSMKAVDFLNFVKFDILGLKTIGIIQDTYRLIGEKWRFAHEIDWEDVNVWEDMIRLNSGIFQFEGSYAHDLLSTFQPRTINDMSLTNASLRPSGKSYRNRLIAREKNGNPSEEIDKLLEENNGFLVFQEDTIKFLTDICDFTGSEADTTRRAIGKKDQDELKKQLPKIKEGYCKHSSQPREIAEKEVEEFVQIVSDSSEYQFGYNHSTGYSMNGYMCARLRYYYPLEFTTSYLNWAEDEDDLNNGYKLLEHYNIELKPPRFRYSRAEYFPDKETNSIYKGIASVKFLNSAVADFLYTLRDKKYDSFSELLFDIKGEVDARKLEILIKLDFFEEFGKTHKLLEVVRAFNMICTKKTYKHDNEFVNYILPYAKKVTEKTIRDVDTLSVIKDIEKDIEDKDIPMTERIKAHFEFVGNCDLKDENVDGRIVVVTQLNLKYAPKFMGYNVSKGKAIELKIKTNTFKENKLEDFDVIMIGKTTSKPKKRKDENGNWIKLEGQSDIWIDVYDKL